MNPIGFVVIRGIAPAVFLSQHFTPNFITGGGGGFHSVDDGITKRKNFESPKPRFRNRTGRVFVFVYFFVGVFGYSS